MTAFWRVYSAIVIYPLIAISLWFMVYGACCAARDALKDLIERTRQL